MNNSDLIIMYYDFWNFLSPDRFNIASFQVPEILKNEFNVEVTYNDNDLDINRTYFEFATKKDKLIFLLKCS